MTRTFLDTNVLVYAADLDAGAKRVRAREAIAQCMRDKTGVLSTQVLKEYFVVVTRKLGVPADIARRQVELFATLEVIPVTVDRILAAIDLHRLHSLSFWDALILQCAADSGSQRLWTEGLDATRMIQGVRIENPFSAI